MQTLATAGSRVSDRRDRRVASPVAKSVQLGRHLAWLRWLAPLAMLAVVIVYEAGPARWLDVRWGSAYHLAAELIFYGTVGPGLVLVLMELLRRWLGERETTELQAHLLAQAQGKDQTQAENTEIAVQKVFAASLLLDSLTGDEAPGNSELGAQLATARQALDEALAQLSKRPSPTLTDAGPR